MKNIIVVFTFLSVVNVFAQDPYTNFDGFERVIITQNANVKGTDYLYGKWNRGVLVMHDTLFFAQNFIRYDAYADRVLVKKHENDPEAFEINDYNLSGFSMVEAETKVKHDFVRLHSSNFVNTLPKGFYEIIFNLEKTNYLIKKTKKVIYDPNKSRGTESQNNVPQEFKSKTTYYLKNADNKYVKVKLRKKDVLKVLPKHKDKMKAYIKSKNINFSKEKQVAQFVNYYYSQF